MLANIKFKAIEDLKMTRAEEYDSDNPPEKTSMSWPNDFDGAHHVAQNNFVIKQADDDMLYQEAYNKCIKNKSVYDDGGKFTPYSTIINTIEQHEALCSVRNPKQDA